MKCNYIILEGAENRNSSFNKRNNFSKFFLHLRKDNRKKKRNTKIKENEKWKKI